MKNKYIKIISATIMIALLVTGCATKQEDESVSRGAKVGAGGGALLGLAMGAMTGDARIAAAGMAVGAGVGAGAGAMHELENTRKTQRTQIMADAIAGKNSTPEAISHGSDLLQEMLGEWNINAWAIVEDNKRVNGSGVAKGIMTSKSSITMNITDIDFPGMAEDMTGFATFTFDDKKGYTLEVGSSTRANKQKYIGEYIKKDDVYHFYATEKDRSGVRLQLRSASESMWSIETYVFIDGKEVQTQSYRFMRK